VGGGDEGDGEGGNGEMDCGGYGEDDDVEGNMIT
jgi:hypothetical protein